MLRGLFFLMAAGLMLTAQANGQLWQHLQANTLTGCSLYMTETECQAHQRILALLSDPRERAAYMAMHTQLIEERRAACGVPVDKRPRNLVSLSPALH